MRFFNKLLDYPTNNYANYQNEAKTYKSLLEEIQAIEDLLECYVTEDTLAAYPELYERFRIRLKGLKDSISMYQKNMARATSDSEREQIKKELERLDAEYKRLFEKTKDDLLELNVISELNNHITEINAIIRKNARFDFFQEFLNKDVWTMDDLKKLRDHIARRKMIINPYIAKMER